MEITYWTGHAVTNNNCAGAVIANETVATGSASDPTPSNATLVSLYATEACRFEYSSDESAATADSAYIGANERLWLQAVPDFIIDTAAA